MSLDALVLDWVPLINIHAVMFSIYGGGGGGLMIQVKFMDIFLDKCACLLLARDNSLRAPAEKKQAYDNT